MKITIDGALADLLFSEVDEGDQEEGFKCVYESDWEDIDRAKYFAKEKVFEKDGKFYVLCDTRSGSYFTDWHYESDGQWVKDKQVSLEQVEKKEKITFEWVTIK